MAGKTFIGIYAGNGRIAAVEARKEGRYYVVLSSVLFPVEGRELKYAIKNAIKALGIKPRIAALSIPDTAANVAIMDFEELPSGKEAKELIMFKISKVLNINPTGYRFRHSILSKENGVKVLAVVTREETIRRYEDALREAGLEVASVNVNTFNLCNLISDMETGYAAAIIVLVENYLSIAICNKKGIIDFYRSKTLKGEAPSEINSTFIAYRGKNPDFDLRNIVVFDETGLLVDALKEKEIPAVGSQTLCISADGARIVDIAILSAIGAGA